MHYAFKSDVGVSELQFLPLQGRRKRQKLPHLWVMMMTRVQRKQLKAARADCQGHFLFRRKYHSVSNIILIQYMKATLPSNF